MRDADSVGTTAYVQSTPGVCNWLHGPPLSSMGCPSPPPPVRPTAPTSAPTAASRALPPPAAHPMHLPHLIDPFKHYLWILKTTHSGGLLPSLNWMVLQYQLQGVRIAYLNAIYGS